MPPKTILVALFTGSVAILLGLWSGLDKLIQELRSFTSVGTLQPIAPSRRPETTVTRQERLCFIAFGAVVILLSVYVTFFRR
jgi:hypothetical protein